MKERVQKLLSRAGYGSRCSCEELIRAGRIKTNGKTVELGCKAEIIRDSITLDGQLISKVENPRVYIAVNKPCGVLSNVDRKHSRFSVRDIVPFKWYLFSVGRLDLGSEGLILMTNDGDLANRLIRPRFQHEREYLVKVSSYPRKKQLTVRRRGIIIKGGHQTAPAKVTIKEATRKGVWLKVIINEGRKRLIRDFGKCVGLPVQRIIRGRLGV